MLLMNLTKENLTGVFLMYTDFARYHFVAMYQFEQLSSIKGETEEQCMKSVQSKANKKLTRIIINTVNRYGQANTVNR